MSEKAHMHGSERLTRLSKNAATTYVIKAAGCDDSTVVRMELTEEEAAVVRRVAEAITATATFNCEPRLYVGLDSERHEWMDDDDEEDDPS